MKVRHVRCKLDKAGEELDVQVQDMTPWFLGFGSEWRLVAMH
jgi:hypothetical protein